VTPEQAASLRAGRSEPWSSRPGVAVLERPGAREAQAFSIFSTCVENTSCTKPGFTLPCS